ncbi:MAG TPA: alkaline phosphatase [Bryobacteraceae bacterium]|nr:alkaline phosphatase [Bryobacteraceae bacterium]
MFTKSIILLLGAVLIAGAQTKPPKRAKNVILFLADAGGVATLNGASLLGYNAPQKLHVQSWPALALSDTSPTGRWVTDSAAGMTAIVTGQKTWNGVISQGPDTRRKEKDGTPLKTILEYAEERGLSTGVLSNVNIADATPAACYAHANDRALFASIFLQIFTPRFGDGVDVVFGPGRKPVFDSVTAAGKDLDAIAKENGRPIYDTIEAVPEEDDRALAVIAGNIDLNAAAKKAIRKLSRNKKGFFLMIESDAHTDDPELGLSRLVSFDKLIAEISELVDLKETLLLFTADHSFDFRIRSGGPNEPLLKGVAEWRQAKAAGNKEPVRLPFVHVDNGHTAEEVVVLAKGPGSELVRGFLPNTRLFEIMLSAYGWNKAASRPTD